jgi:NDP-sugar pyrophosphorylase family protein
LLDFHRDNQSLVTLAAMRMTAGARYGTVDVNAENRVMAFREKDGSVTTGLVNAGVYVFSQAVLDHIPEGPSSLEKDIFPKLLPHGIYALEQQGLFIDIGIPEDYARAQELSGSLYAAAFNRQAPPRGHGQRSES